jgi:hypothetical protein
MYYASNRCASSLSLPVFFSLFCFAFAFFFFSSFMCGDPLPPSVSVSVLLSLSVVCLCLCVFSFSFISFLDFHLFISFSCVYFLELVGTLFFSSLFALFFEHALCVFVCASFVTWRRWRYSPSSGFLACFLNPFLCLLFVLPSRSSLTLTSAFCFFFCSFPAFLPLSVFLFLL